MKHELLAKTAPDAKSPESGGTARPQSADACPACGEAALVAREVTTVFGTEHSLAVVRDIPAMVCPSCREEFLDDRTAMELDLMRGGDFAGQTPAAQMTVPVYAFRPASRGET